MIRTNSSLLGLDTDETSRPRPRVDQRLAALDAKRPTGCSLGGAGVQRRDQLRQAFRRRQQQADRPGDHDDKAAARPARRRSWISDLSNCANAPKTWNRNSPCGVVVSICSVSERKAMPRFLRSVIVVRRCGNDRPNRSSFQTTRQSPALMKASAFARPVRSPRLPLARSSEEVTLIDTGSEQEHHVAGPALWRSLSVETRM